jgi:hypothetical protein
MAGNNLVHPRGLPHFNHGSTDNVPEVSILRNNSSRHNQQLPQRLWSHFYAGIKLLLFFARHLHDSQCILIEHLMNLLLGVATAQ